MAAEKLREAKGVDSVTDYVEEKEDASLLAAAQTGLAGLPAANAAG